MNPGKMLHQPGGRLLALAVAAVIVVGMCVSMLGMAERFLQKDDDFLAMMPAPKLDVVMPLPRLEDVPAPPTANELDQRVAALVAQPQLASLELPVPANEMNIAWGAAIMSKDTASPPLPIAFPAERFLAPGDIALGVAVAMRVYLLDATTTTGGWQQAVVRLDESEHYALALIAAGQAELDVGQAVQGVGRYVGHVQRMLPGEQAGDEIQVDFPVIMFRNWRAVTVDPGEDSLKGLLPDWAGRLELWRPNADIWQRIDDDRPIFSLEPYYHALGMMAYQREFHDGIDLADDTLLDANDYAVKLHHQPWDYRKRQVRVEGRVYRAWYDPDVTRDQPYGVGRVMRVQLWNTVFGVTRSVIIDGAETQINTPFLAVYELAVLVDDEMALPNFGDRFHAVGRFVRMQGHRADQDDPLVDQAMGFYRQSQNIYFRFLVAYQDDVANWGPVRKGGFRWVYVVAFAVALAFMALAVVLVMRERNPQQARKRIFVRTRRRRRQQGQPQKDEQAGVAAASES
jgi:hypothetical protein